MYKVPLQRDFIRKDFSKMCTSKLSKRDMEDKYFSLLENNLQLKKTINEQKEHLKILTTKISRMTAVQSSVPKNEKSCCTNYKCIINEQKDVIQDLVREKEKLMLKIKQLTMKLCSAKQFLRSNLNHSGRARSTRGVNTTKDSIPSVLNSGRTESHLHSPKSPTNGLPSIEEEVLSSVKSNESDSNNKDRENTEKLSYAKRHNAQIEELKQKIVHLQEELSATHESSVARVESLQSEVSHLTEESSNARLAYAASQQDMRRCKGEAEQLAAKMRAVEGHTGQLKIQLSIEKKKVLELETQLKAENFSKEVSKMIVKHLHASNTKIEQSKIENSDTIASSVQGQIHSNTNQDVSACKCSVTCNEHLNRINEELQKTIILLQTKLDQLKVSRVAESIQSPKKNGMLTYDNSDSDVSTIKNGGTHKGNASSLPILSTISYGNNTLERNDVNSIEENKSKVDISVGTSGLKLEFKSDTIHKDTTSPKINVLGRNGPSKFSKPPKDNIGINEKHFASTPNSEEPRKTLQGSLPKTYTIEVSVKKNNGERSISSENTDYDVSSISEVCSPKLQTNSSVNSPDHSRSTCATSRSPLEYLSLGEDRGISTLTEECSVISLELGCWSLADKSQGYLSDGEIPSVSGKRHLSGTENGLKKTSENGDTKLFHIEVTKAELINVALEQVTEELARCRHIQKMTNLALSNTHAK